MVSGILVILEFCKVLETYAEGKRSEIQVFLKTDDEAWREKKKSFRFCNCSSRTRGRVAREITISMSNSSSKIFIVEYDWNAGTAILSISIGAEGPQDREAAARCIVSLLVKC